MMKNIKILIIMSLLLTCKSIYAQQCTSSGLKIQTPLCDTPKNLRIIAVSCTAVKLDWQGNAEQQYVLEVTGTDAADELLFDEKNAKYSCTSGNCTATINVQEGTRINWSVQGICTISGATLYRPKSIGKEMVTGNCQTANKESVQDKSADLLKIFPNPSSGPITVEYVSAITEPATIRVYDANGKIVATTPVKAIKGSNIYRLNLSTVAVGMYNLEVISGVVPGPKTNFAIQR